MQTETTQSKEVDPEENTQVRKSQNKNDTVARNVRKFANRRVFPMIRGSGGSKSRLAKAADAESCGRRRNEKLHAAAAQSTFPSQNAKKLTASPLFEVQMRKNCSEKHVSKSKCTKHTRLKFRCRKIAHRCGAKHKSPNELYGQQSVPAVRTV